MGTQIALQCAVYGYPVWLVSRSEATLQRAAQSQTQELDHRLAQQRLTAREQETILHRIQYTTHVHDGVREADLVIENVPERLDLKREGRVPAGCGYCFGTSPNPSERDQSADDQLRLSRFMIYCASHDRRHHL